MQITFDTNSEADLAQLKAFLNGYAAETTETSKPSNGTAPAKKTAAKKAAAKPAPEPEDEVVEGEIVEEPEESLMEQAVQKATKMVSDGKAAAVKAALEKAGARRVSELDGDDAVRKFLEALS